MPRSNITQEDLQRMNEMFERLFEEIQQRRDQVTARPRHIVTMLAGDCDLGGPYTGLLDAIAEGIANEAGVGGKRNADRLKEFKNIVEKHLHAAGDEFAAKYGEAPTAAEFAWPVLFEARNILRAHLDDMYGAEYRAAKKKAETLVAATPSGPTIDATTINDPAFM